MIRSFCLPIIDLLSRNGSALAALDYFLRVLCSLTCSTQTYLIGYYWKMLEGRKVHERGIIAETEFLGSIVRPQPPGSYACCH